MFEACLLQAAQMYSVHPYLIQSIAWVESRGHPWALNIKSLKRISLKKIRARVVRRGNYFYYSVFPSSKKEALKVLSSMKGIVSVDYGLMQINSYWLRKLGLTSGEILDPCLNLYVGAYIIAYCRSKKREWWDAIECYHRSERANGAGSYAAKVCSVLYGEDACRF